MRFSFVVAAVAALTTQKADRSLVQTGATLKACGRGFRYSCMAGEECHAGYCYTDGGWEGWANEFTSGADGVSANSAATTTF